MLYTREFPAFERTFSCATVSWLRLDTAGKVQDACAAAARALGYSTRACLIAAAPVLTDLARSRTQSSPAFRDGNPWRTVALTCADGRLMNARAFSIAGHGDTHDVLFVGNAETADRVAESQSESWQSDRRYRSLLDLSQSGLCIKRQDTRLVYVNRALAHMLGYEPEELIERCGRDFFVPEDIPKVTDVLFGKPWEPGEMREVAARMRMKHDRGVRHVVIRKAQIHYQGQVAFLASVNDVTDLRRGEKVLTDYAKRLRGVSRQVLEVQENERRHLARELHDEIGQQLTLVKLSLARVVDGSGQPEVQQALDTVSELMRQVRDLSLALRPSMLDDLGLAATLRWYIGRAARLAALDVRIEVAADFPRLSSETETLCFRIAQEAITNVLRHAGARVLILRLFQDGDIVELSVVDDGAGFDPGSARSTALKGGSAGLLGMQERAVLAGAELELISRPGAGTSVRLVIPGNCAGIRKVRA